jgi:F-box/leucine-rich repeat protein 10/11
VIDVKSQQGEDKRWNMQKWADYYESNEHDKPVRNVISLEVSQSRLGRLIKRPKVVRDLDLQDAVWPDELMAIGEYPKVQFYCLMSVADCYTDFHIDFGGSSVYYHILKGKKTFFFIPPKDKHLKKYEEWCNSPAQDSIFLGNQTKECYRVDLSEGDTMLIPSGWIHAVWTPENSLVIGGNFLTRLNYGMQIKVLNIEKDTKVPKKFRYPFFQKIQWYTALGY